MSLGSEYEAEYEFEHDYPYCLPGEYWHSRNGKIKVCNMTNLHIENCMKIVGEDDQWYSYFKNELNKRKKPR